MGALARVLYRRCRLQNPAARECRCGAAGGDGVLREPGDARRPGRRLARGLVFAPRLIRRVAGAPCLRQIGPDGMRLHSSFALFETMLNQPSTLFLCGRLYDRVVEDADVLRFAERIVVTDATNVPLSLIYPI